jgi:apolipoprotein D and lipocalin family protein
MSSTAPSGRSRTSLSHERHGGLSASDRGQRRAFAAVDAVVFGAATLGVGALIASCARPVGNPRVPEPAKPVELSRYLGRWYEIARYDSSFERGCEGVTAEYSLRPYGLIRVLNTCRMGSPEGRSRVAEGKAKIVPGSGNAKLKVSFFGPFFFGSYWVLDHADDYSWSIVGEPTGKYLWILSRGATPVDADRQARAQELGYDTSLLRMTRQPPMPPN